LAAKPRGYVMVRVRNSSAAALHRIQMRRLRHEWETKAAHDRRANRDVQDEAIQELFGIGLAMQITKREVAPQSAARMGGHINQLQGLITGFRAAIADVRAEPVNVPQ
jgi:signal transduction histidine kinase